MANVHMSKCYRSGSTKKKTKWEKKKEKKKTSSIENRRVVRKTEDLKKYILKAVGIIKMYWKKNNVLYIVGR